MARFPSFLHLSFLKQTFFRFSSSIIFSFLTFLFVVNDINNFISLPKEWGERAILFLTLGFFWLVGVKIFSESHRLSKRPKMLISCIGLSVYALFSLISSEYYNADIILMLAHLAFANLLLLFIAPYIGHRSDNDSLWEYNRRFCFGVCLAFVTAVIFWAGFSGALASIGYLFDINISGKVYMTLWSFAAIILAPIYALSLVPTQFQFSREECALKNALQFIVKWVLLPLVFIYFIILYAYFLKITVLWEIPKGQLSWMIIGFAGAGIITFLIAWPYEIEGQKIFKIFRKYFFPLLILPSLMLCMAVYLRVDQYGVTEQRFYLALVALYLLIVSTTLSFYRHQLKVIFSIGVILILLSSTPIFNAKSVSEWSQTVRLKTLLKDNGLFKNGKIIPAVDQNLISDRDRSQVTQIFWYLMRLKRDDNSEIFMGHNVIAFGGRDEFEKIFGFAPLYRYDYEQQKRMAEHKRFSIRLRNCASRSCLTDVRGYDAFLDHGFHINHSRTHNISSADSALYALNKFDVLLENNQLVFVFDDDLIRIDLNNTIESLLQDYPSIPDDHDNIILEGHGNRYKLRVVIDLINGEYDKETPIIKSLNLRFMIGRHD